MRTVVRTSLIGAAVALVTACGDIGTLELDVTFPNEDVELRTRALRIVVREVPPDGSSGCDALWSDPIPGLRQTERTTAFPNRNDVLAAAVSLDYPALNLFVYGHPGVRSETSQDPDTGAEETRFAPVGDPIVGGCVTQLIEDPGATASFEVPLVMAP